MGDPLDGRAKMTHATRRARTRPVTRTNICTHTRANRRSCQGPNVTSSGRDTDDFATTTSSIDRAGARRRSVGLPGLRIHTSPVARDLRHVAVRVDDRMTVGKQPQKPRVPARTPAGVVNHPDPRALHLEHPPLGKELREAGLVVVAQDPDDGR